MSFESRVIGAILFFIELLSQRKLEHKVKHPKSLLVIKDPFLT